MSFTPDQSATLTHQILAYKLLAQNKPLPTQLQAAIFTPGEALRQSQAGQGKIGLINDEVKDEAELVAETAEATRLRLLAESDPSVNDVEDPTSLIYPYNSFSNPLSSHLTGKPSHRVTHIPTLLPPGLDSSTIAEERNRFINARVNQRISELESLPSDLSQQSTLSDNSTLTTSQKIKALIELKSLNLLARQKALRQDVIRGFNQASSLSLACDRSNFRRFKKQTIRDARQTEATERTQKQGRETRAKQKHTDHLVEITEHGKRLDAAHRLHASKFAKLGRSLLKFHVDAEKDEQKRVERVSKERLRALRADDEEGYLALIDTAKDTRITHLLRQTDAFLDSLATAVVAQQSTAKVGNSRAIVVATPVVEAQPPAIEGEAVDEGRFGAVPVFEEEVKDKVDYYNVAHAIKETITEQPKMLIGGQLKSYQLKGLEWMISLYNNHVNGILADEMVSSLSVESNRNTKLFLF